MAGSGPTGGLCFGGLKASGSSPAALRDERFVARVCAEEDTAATRLPLSIELCFSANANAKRKQLFDRNYRHSSRAGGSNVNCVLRASKVGTAACQHLATEKASAALEISDPSCPPQALHRPDINRRATPRETDK